MDNKERIAYLKQTHSEVRGEIVERIKQRDTFAIQFIVTMGTVFTVGFLDFKFAPFVFFMLPILAIFYSVQIMYSYVIHDRCNKFLKEEIEPELAKLLSYSEYNKSRLMWESYCDYDSKKNLIKTPGIRKGFFEKAVFIVPVISSLLFLLLAYTKNLFPLYVIIIISSSFLCFYEIVSIMLILRFNLTDNANVYKQYSEIDYLDEKAVNDTSIKKAVFLDRDGTIHLDKVNTHKIEDLEYFKDTMAVLKDLQKMGYTLVLVTNQDGIRKKIYTEKEMHAFNQRILQDMKDNDIDISAIYFSPYRREDNNFSFKPNPGMLLRAKYELNISMEDSFFIGDQMSDAIAAVRAGVVPILVRTGLYKRKIEEETSYEEIKPKVFENLTESLECIKDFTRTGN